MPFNPASVIAKKRDGLALTRDEIAEFVSGFTNGSVPDYQMSALAMAIYLRGMSEEETAALTEQMLASGVTIRWADDSVCVDKHSTGGVGDKVSLLLAPLLACCGLRVPMISGRGLGPTGGTLDKLESIPGFRTDLSLDEIREITRRVGCVITGASAEIAPADRKLYAAGCDGDGRFDSADHGQHHEQELAEGLDALVLDVKVGSGAFMKTLDQARELARSLVETGNRMGVPTTALITDMSQPLGRMAGNAVEVNETVAALGGAKGPDDLIALTNSLGAELLVATGQASLLKMALSKCRGTSTPVTDSGSSVRWWPHKEATSMLRARLLPPRSSKRRVRASWPRSMSRHWAMKSFGSAAAGESCRIRSTTRSGLKRSSRSAIESNEADHWPVSSRIAQMAILLAKG